MPARERWKAQRRFDQRGGLAIFVTCFMVCSPAIPVNLIAGGSRYSYWRFLGLEVVGELIWLVLFGGLSYAL